MMPASNLPSLIEQAKENMPLPKLLQFFGHGYAAKPNVKHRSPIREEKSASFEIKLHENKWVWKDWGSGLGGDEIDYIATAENLSPELARERYYEIAGVKKLTPLELARLTFSKITIHPSAPVFDWDECRRDFDEEKQASLAAARGYRPDFVKWLRAQDLIGIYEGGYAIPVHGPDGTIIGCHYKAGDDWRYTQGAKTVPLVIGEPSADKFAVVFESQWDQFAMLDAFSAEAKNEWDGMFYLVSTRGANNAGKAEEVLLKGNRIIAVEQNDRALKPEEKPFGNHKWTEDLAKISGKIQYVAPPPGIKDFNDWHKVEKFKGATLFPAIFNAAKTRARSRLSLRSAADLLKMTHDDTDNYLGDRMMSKGAPCSFLGSGGIGKSRVLLQLAICSILGDPWLGMETHMKGKKWLFVQTENSNRRMTSDLSKMLRGLDRMDQKYLNALGKNLLFHTIETDEDGFLDLSTSDERSQVKYLIEDNAPDIVVWDPLNTFTSGDLNSDVAMREVVTSIIRLTKSGNPERTPIIVHHALTGKAGVEKATGWDKASFGRNSKVLHNAVRSQWNLTSRDKDDQSLLLLAGGKNNDGRLPPNIGVVFDEQNWIYKIDPDFKEGELEASLKGKGAVKMLIPVTSLPDMFEGSVSRGELAAMIQERFSVGEHRASQVIQEAILARVIRPESKAFKARLVKCFP